MRAQEKQANYQKRGKTLVTKSPSVIAGNLVLTTELKT